MRWLFSQQFLIKGKPIDKGLIHKLLHNRTYLGELRHKEQWYPAEHLPIIDPKLWHDVQAILSTNYRVRGGLSRTRVNFLLKGIVFGNDGRLTLSVPIQFKRRAGRKQITLPNGEPGEPRPWGISPTALQLALARGHRWLAMLESGKVNSLREIAAMEGVDNSYVSRMMNLTVLAPDIVEAILDDALPDHVTLFDIAVDPPTLWGNQRALIGLWPPHLKLDLTHPA